MSRHEVASRPSPPEGEDSRAPARGVVVKLLVLVAVLAGLGGWVVLGDGPSLAEVRDWVGSLGIWGPLVFALVYALAVALLLPGSVLGASPGHCSVSRWVRRLCWWGPPRARRSRSAWRGGWGARRSPGSRGRGGRPGWHAWTPFWHARAS